MMECILMCSVAPTVTFKTCVNLEQRIYGNYRNREKYSFTLNYRKLLKFKDTFVKITDC